MRIYTIYTFINLPLFLFTTIEMSWKETKKPTIKMNLCKKWQMLLFFKLLTTSAFLCEQPSEAESELKMKDREWSKRWRA